MHRTKSLNNILTQQETGEEKKKNSNVSQPLSVLVEGLITKKAAVLVSTTADTAQTHGPPRSV